MSLDKRLGMRFLPYGANYLDWDDMTELRDAVRDRVLFRYQRQPESCATRLEEHAARRLGARHVLAVHNCTEALRLALVVTRPRIGDVVHIPAMTFVAVAGAVLSTGLVPVPVDIDENLSLDAGLLPADAQRVIVAHMEGGLAEVPAHVPYVIEDAAQALGSRFPDGTHAGTKGFAGTFSFHHNKVLTSGEGGLVTTNDETAYSLMRSYHDHGSARQPGRYPVWNEDAFWGENLVTSEEVAAIQLQQFRHLDEVLAGLQRHYDIMVAELPRRSDMRPLPRTAGEVKISVRLELDSRELRDRAVATLTEQGVPNWTLDKYFLPAHPVLTGRRSLYADGFPWSFAPDTPETAGLSRDGFAATRERLGRIVCLPLFPELSADEQAVAAKNARALLEQL